MSRAEILATFADFGGQSSISAELIAWEFCVSPAVIAGLWSRLVDDELIAPAGDDPLTGEATYLLTEAGWGALAESRGVPHRNDRPACDQRVTSRSHAVMNLRRAAHAYEIAGGLHERLGRFEQAAEAFARASGARQAFAQATGGRATVPST